MIAERIRRSLAASDLAGPGTAAVDPRNLVTVSCGISEFREGDDLDNMLFRSDQALYLCKDRGGNCVEKERLTLSWPTDPLGWSISWNRTGFPNTGRALSRRFSNRNSGML